MRNITNMKKKKKLPKYKSMRNPRSMGGAHPIDLHCTPTRPPLYLYQASCGAPWVHPLDNLGIPSALTNIRGTEGLLNVKHNSGEVGEGAEEVCNYEPYFKHKRGVIVVQNRHRTSAYFGSAVQVQRKSILSAVLLMCSLPTWDITNMFSNSNVVNLNWNWSKRLTLIDWMSSYERNNHFDFKWWAWSSYQILFERPYWPLITR